MQSKSQHVIVITDQHIHIFICIYVAIYLVSPSSVHFAIEIIVGVAYTPRMRVWASYESSDCIISQIGVV